MPAEKGHSELKKRATRREDEPKLIGSWRTGKTIGKGSSGRVKIARHVRTGQYAAVKIVSKHALMSSRLSMSAAGEQADKILLAIEREIVIMKLVDHPNVLSLYDVWETSDELYLIMEYVEGGELFDYLVSRGRLSLPEALHYFQQIISAVDYCHRFNIAHRDLKPENLLLDRSRKNIKVADFGMAAWEGGSAAGGMLETSCGSPHYASPEIVQGKKYSGACSDIWSCGVILYALCTGRLPFDHPDIRTLLQMVKKGDYVMPPDLPSSCKHLISRMLEKDVNKRITMPEILQHPFFVSRAPRPIAGRTVSPPSLEEVARPVASAADIDADIFANLRTLWHGAPDDEIMEGLLNNEKTWEKAVYHLLLQYRARHLENFNMDEDDAVPHPKRHRTAPAPPVLNPKMEEIQSQTPQATPPARPSAPTPKRAAGEESSADTPSRHPIFRGVSEPRNDSGIRLLSPVAQSSPRTTSRSPRPLPSPQMEPAETSSRRSAPPASPRVEQGPRLPEKPFLAPPAPIPDRPTPSTPSSLSSPAVPAISLQTPTPQRTPERRTNAAPASRAPSPASLPPTPALSAGSPSTIASSIMSPKLPILVPQTNDPVVQQFFNDIVEHLSKIEARHSLFVASGQPSPTPSTASNANFPPFTLAHPPPPTPASATFSISDPTQFEDAREEASAAALNAQVGLGISGNEGSSHTAPSAPTVGVRASLLPPAPQLRNPPGHRGSAPPSAPRRPAPTPTRTRAYSMDSPSKENKENLTPRRSMEVTRSALDARDLGRDGFVIVERSEAMEGRHWGDRRNVLGERHVQIVLPNMPDRTLKKKKSIISKASSILSTSSSEDIPMVPPMSYSQVNAPKRPWFNNLFNFKAPQYELLSRYNMAVSRDECRKMLQNLGVTVLLQNADGPGVLKCRLDEIRDPAGVMAVTKAVRFRVEFHLTTSVQNAAGYTTVMTLIQEKGALSTLKVIYARFRQEWEATLDSPRPSEYLR
ncbi:Pkinase-domain-containing protein [Calocera viscosa TUFC12733]|uniref:non-specific serine/threonine protein kinase n=1 Tax=Calocera viscosa (strain TUFC12733) TaxID=1330018 RepID=A0A167S8T0_CALVF|nr:Pkinase-domain-containing protein [Calocera viscosa TUFC12733]